MGFFIREKYMPSVLSNLPEQSLKRGIRFENKKAYVNSRNAYFVDLLTLGFFQLK